MFAIFGASVMMVGAVGYMLSALSQSPTWSFITSGTFALGLVMLIIGA